MFKNISKEELQDIYLDYKLSKSVGNRCESLVPFAEEYKKQMKIGDLMSTAIALDIVKVLFFEEVADRYVNNFYKGGHL